MKHTESLAVGRLIVALRDTILLGGIWCRGFMTNALRMEKRGHRVIDEFTPIVGAENLHTVSSLCLDIDDQLINEFRSFILGP